MQAKALRREGPGTVSSLSSLDGDVCVCAGLHKGMVREMSIVVVLMLLMEAVSSLFINLGQDVEVCCLSHHYFLPGTPLYILQVLPLGQSETSLPC